MNTPLVERSTTPLKISGHGLVTGLPVEVSIEPAPQGQGIVFHLSPEVAIPARLESIANAERGITLGHPSGAFLVLVEHFLSACSMAGLEDAHVHVHGAPELPILDGSAAEWVRHFEAAGLSAPVTPDIALTRPVFYRQSKEVLLYALPAEHFQVTYAVNFPHPGLKNQWIRWDSQRDGISQISQARTFGFVRELPALQEKGLAKGVSLENTLGLTDDGGYTTPLRFEEEPVFHKALDLIGDLTLMGLNPLRLKAHVFAFQAGHDSHTAFAKKLQAVL